MGRGLPVLSLVQIFTQGFERTIGLSQEPCGRQADLTNTKRIKKAVQAHSAFFIYSLEQVIGRCSTPAFLVPEWGQIVQFCITLSQCENIDRVGNQSLA